MTGVAKLARPTTTTWVIAGLFLLICLVVVLAGDPSCLTYGAHCATEADRYGQELATVLYEQGRFSSVDNTNIPYVTHPPLHALILTGTFFLAGQETYIPILIIHIAFNLATGFLVRAIALQILGRYGDVAMAAYLINPNVLAHTNLVGTDTLPAFFIAGAALVLLRYVGRPSLRKAIVCGLLLGVGAMIRPISQMLIVALPLAFPLLAVIGNGWRVWRSSLLAGVIALVAALAMVAPWMTYMNSQGYGYTIVNPSHFRLLLTDSLTLLTPAGPSKRVLEAKGAFMEQQVVKMAATVPGWESMGRGERTRMLASDTLDYYLSFPFEPSVVAKALAYSWGRFLISGGSGYVNARLGISEDRPDRGIAFYTVYALTHLFTVASRALGLLGIAWLIARRRWEPLLVLAIPIGVVMLTTVMVGLPRYRAAVEPELAILAAIGLMFVVDLARKRRVNGGSRASPETLVRG